MASPCTLGELGLLSAAERAQIVIEGNDTAEVSRGERPRAVSAQAARTPDAVAVAQGASRLTYGELDDRSSRLALYLREHGVGPEVPVGCCVERSLEMVVGWLGILRPAACTCRSTLPTPGSAGELLLADSAVALVLTRSS